MKKIFYDHTWGPLAIPANPINGWSVLATSNHPNWPLDDRFVPAAEVTVCIAHCRFNEEDMTSLADLRERALANDGEFFFVLASRQGPTALRRFHSPVENVFASYEDALTGTAESLIGGEEECAVGRAIAAINDVQPAQTVRAQAEAVRNALNHMVASVQHDQGQLDLAIAIAASVQDVEGSSDFGKKIEVWLANEGVSPVARIEAIRRVEDKFRQAKP